MSFLDLPWGRLAFQDHLGRRRLPPLLLLHGTGCSQRDWEPVLTELQAGNRCLILDFRGHGDSSVPDRLFTLEDLAEDVMALSESLNLERFVLAGHSLGGMVAMAAARRSDRICGLVLVEGWTSLAAAREAFVGERFYGRLPTSVIDRIRQQAETTQSRFLPEVWRHFWHSVEQFDAGEFLERTRLPVVELYGSLGRSPDTGTRLRIPRRKNIAVEWAEGAGHYLTLECPAAVAAACRQGWELSALLAPVGLPALNGIKPFRRPAANRYPGCDF